MSGRILAALALSVLPACDPGQDAPDRESRPYQALVGKQRGLPLEQRVAAYLPLARRLSPAGKTRTEEEALATLAREIVRAGDFAVIEALEREVDGRARKSVFWWEVSRAGDRADAPRLLARWAAGRPDEILLARHRPGGVEFLLATLEDPAADPRRRADCARELSYTADVALVPRMARLADDPAPVGGRSLPAGRPVPTLGSIVKRCIENLERFARERDGE
jgi:hypothetical protein